MISTRRQTTMQGQLQMTSDPWLQAQGSSGSDGVVDAETCCPDAPFRTPSHPFLGAHYIQWWSMWGINVWLPPLRQENPERRSYLILETTTEDPQVSHTAHEDASFCMVEAPVSRPLTIRLICLVVGYLNRKSIAMLALINETLQL